MKNKFVVAILTFLFVLFSILGYCQTIRTDTINQRNGAGKKDGLWIQYLDSFDKSHNKN